MTVFIEVFGVYIHKKKGGESRFQGKENFYSPSLTSVWGIRPDFEPRARMTLICTWCAQKVHKLDKRKYQTNQIALLDALDHNVLQLLVKILQLSRQNQTY